MYEADKNVSVANRLFAEQKEVASSRLDEIETSAWYLYSSAKEMRRDLAELEEQRKRLTSLI